MTTDVLPNTNLTYNLGSPSKQWRSLYVGTSTIYIGGTALSVSTSGSLTVNGAPVSSFNTATLVTRAVSANTASFATTASYAQSFNTGTLVTAAVSATNIVNGTWTLALSTAGSILINGTVFSGGSSSATTSTLVNGTSTVSLSSAGTLTFPDATVQTTAWTGSVSSLVNSTQTVSLSTTGNLTFTNGEQIKTNFLGGGIELYQSSDNTIGIYPGGAEIKTFVTGGPKYKWLFGTTGNTTFPTGLILGAPRGVNTVNFTCTVDKEFQIETQTTSTGKLWRFGTDGITTFPDGTTSTGNIVVANSSSYQIKTNYSIANNPYTASFEFNEAKLVLPGNGVIKNGSGSWALDTSNGQFTFPNNSRINYGLSNVGLTVDDLKIQAINTGNVVISASGNNWIFGSNGLTLPTFAGSPSIVTIESFSSISLGSNLYYWNFGSDGKLTLPTPNARIASNVTFTDIVTFSNTATYIQSTASSISTTTGALTVVGGVGVGGGVFVGGTVTATTFTGLASTGTTSTTAAVLGYMGMPQNSTATSYTLAAGDQGKHIYITATGQTITVPANGTTAFPIGTTIAIIAGPSATSSSIAITTDTMYLGGTGTTGTRTLAAYGMATLVKVAATTWFINGSGLT